MKHRPQVGWSDRLRRALSGRPRPPTLTTRKTTSYPSGPSRDDYPQRHPVYGGQAHRDTHYAPYVVGFAVMIAALAGFLYLGLNWATGPGRLAAIANPPTSVPTPTPPVAAPTPSPPPAEQIYIVKAGDNPATIAQRFGVKTQDLMDANNIDDPSKLQIGQALKIPPPSH
jgi:LysM repeat protein